MDKVLGIIGGGQLGKMLLQYVSRLSLTTHVYDQSNESPCKNLCNSFMLLHRDKSGEIKMAIHRRICNLWVVNLKISCETLI